MNNPSVTDNRHRTPGQGRYVVLNFADLHLLLPYSEIHTLEPRSDVQTGEEEDGTAGWLAVDGQNWPVVCLDSDLELTTPVPVERRVCVLLHHRNGYAGVLCETVATLEAQDVQVFPLPPALGVSATPVLGLVTYDGRLGCLTSSMDLLSRLPLPTDSGARLSREPAPVTEVSP